MHEVVNVSKRTWQTQPHFSYLRYLLEIRHSSTGHFMVNGPVTILLELIIGVDPLGKFLQNWSAYLQIDMLTYNVVIERTQLHYITTEWMNGLL